MLIASCSNGIHIAGKIASKIKAQYTQLRIKRFPDGELYLRFLKNPGNKEVVLVQSFYGNIDELIVETLFAASTAKDLGARKIILAAPYFPYLRQDNRFKEGECISLKVIAKLFDAYFDKLIIVDPHLHRKDTLSSIFRTGSVKLSSNQLIANYIKSGFKDPVIIGPDWESYKWAEKVAEMIQAESSILEKKRYSSHYVKVKMKEKVKLKGREVVIVDDIISTGHTILETIKKIKKLQPKNISCICVHGIFAENALEKIKKTGAKVLATNTIPSAVSGIDVSGLVAGSLG